MIDWKAKLCSRKFWMAIIGLISGIMLAFKVDAETVETVSGVVLSAGSVIAYIVGEGLIDAAGASTKTPIVFNTDMFDDADTKENSDNVDNV